MAFPTTRARASGAQNSDSTTHVIAMPGGTTTPGDVILVFFSCDGAVSIDSTPGYTGLGRLAQGGDCTHAVVWRRATGTDALTITTNTAQQSTHISISVSNATDPQAMLDQGDSAPWVTFSALSPTQGATDYLCIIGMGVDSSTGASQSVVGVPAEFGDLTSQNPSGVNSASTFTCESEVTNSSLAPLYATLNHPEQWVSSTVAMAFELHESPTGSLTQPVIRSESSSWVAATGNVIVPRPSGLGVGDLMLAFLVASHEERDIFSCNWDRSDAIIWWLDGRDPGWVSPYQASARLFARIATADDVAQPSFVFTRSWGGQVGVHITAFEAGTFNPTNPLADGMNAFVWDDPNYWTSSHFISSATAVNQGILMGFFGCSTEGNAWSYPTSSPMNFVGRITTGWLASGVYWQYSPSSGDTSPYYVQFSASTSQFLSLAIVVQPLAAVARIRSGRGAARGAPRGWRDTSHGHLRTGKAAGAGAGHGTSARATVAGQGGKGVAALGATGVRSGGVGSAVAAVGDYLPVASGTSAAVPVPAGVSSGRTVLVALWLDAAASLSVTKPANFTELTSPPETATTVSSTRLFWTQASGSDTGTYTFSWTGAHRYEGVALLLARTRSSGAPASPFEDAARASSAGVVVSTTPAVSGTASAVDRLGLWVGGASSQADWAPPEGWRLVVAGARLAVACQRRDAGATGSVTGQGSGGWARGWGDAWGH